MINLESLKKKYSHKRDHLIFTRDRVVNILKSKFKAEEFDYKILLDLPNDDHFKYENIFIALSITDEKVLANLFNDIERRNHREDIIDNREKPLNFKRIKKNNEQVYNHILLDEQEGRRVDIILESDGTFFTEFQVRAECEYVNKYINALVVGAQSSNGSSDIEEELDDDFVFYLQNLNKFGFLE